MEIMLAGIPLSNYLESGCRTITKHQGNTYELTAPAASNEKKERRQAPLFNASRFFGVS